MAGLAPRQGDRTLRVRTRRRSRLPQRFGYTTCIFAGWLEGRPIGLQEASPNAGTAHAVPFSLVLGAELQPGLYKLRLWATCTHAVRNQRVSVTLLEKAPSELNPRAVTGEDLAHKQR
jgi:hypothetical protein